MPWKQIKVYKAYWRPELNHGVLSIGYDGGSDSQSIESPQEMLLVLDILRNERPVSFHTDTKAIATGAEPVGEEET
jgi:hypothetical protein